MTTSIRELDPLDGENKSRLYLKLEVEEPQQNDNQLKILYNDERRSSDCSPRTQGAEDLNTSQQEDVENTEVTRTPSISEGEQNTKEELKPPDGGWGWLVTFGGFINTALSPMVGTCFAIIFSRFLLDLKTSSTTVAWIYNLQSSIFNLAGLMIGPLAQEFGWRRVTFIGTLLNSLSLITSAFAPSAEFFYFSYVILSGIGSGATVCASMLIVQRFFDKKRGRANSILMAGFSIGQMMGPPCSTYLQGEYGFTGGTLLIGAILLNGCVAACLFHPLEWHMKKVKVDVDFKVSEVYEKETLLNDRDHVHPRKGSVASLSSLGDSTIENMRPVTTSVQEAQEKIIESKAKRGNTCAIFNVFVRVVRTTITNLRILRYSRAVIIAVGNTLFVNGYINFMMMVPFAMQAAGHSLESAAWCMSIAAICNLLSRIITNSLTDFPWFNLKIFHNMGLATVAICNFVFPLLNDLHWLMVTMGVWGCGMGATMGVYTLIMVEVMGLEKSASCFGATCFIIAIGYITVGPLMGYMRDVSSSYAVSIWMSASLVTISFVLWLLMPVAVDYDKKKEEDNSKSGRKSP